MKQDNSIYESKFYHCYCPMKEITKYFDFKNRYHELVTSQFFKTVNGFTFFSPSEYYTTSKYSKIVSESDYPIHTFHFIYRRIDNCEAQKRNFAQKTQFVKHQRDTLTNQLTNKIAKNCPIIHNLIRLYVFFFLRRKYPIILTSYRHTIQPTTTRPQYILYP